MTSRRDCEPNISDHVQVAWDLIVGPEAEAEIAATQDWYDERIPGLGAEFIAALIESDRSNCGKPFSISDCVEELPSGGASPISLSRDLRRLWRYRQGGSLHSRRA